MLVVNYETKEYNNKGFSIMSKIKYKVVENTKVGTHSFYAVPVPNGTLSFDELCEEACDGKSVEPSIMKACVSEYMKAAQRNILKGFRVSLGDEFLFLYPNLQATAKDTVDADGKVTKAATAADVKVKSGRSRIGASISPKFSSKFANEVSWQRVDPATGTDINPDDDATQSASSSANTSTSSSASSSAKGGNE